MISEEHYMDEHQEQEEALVVVTIRAILEEMKAEINLAAMEIIETEGAEVEVVIVMTDVNVADLQEEEKGVQEDIKTYKGKVFCFGHLYFIEPHISSWIYIVNILKTIQNVLHEYIEYLLGLS